MELTEQRIAELVQKHGEGALVQIKTPTGVPMVFVKPDKEIWAYYQDSLTRDKIPRTTCFLRLSLDCVVEPGPQEAVALFAKFAGMPTVVAGELSKLAGLSDELDIKKL